jgi:hypothetical protein
MESLPREDGESRDSEDSPGSNFLERVCIPRLRHAQNEDGGWGFKAGSRSRVEPTAWAMLALGESASIAIEDQGRARGVRFLESSQLADGSWPSSPESTEGCWVTALACWALLRSAHTADAVARGMAWLCSDRPGESRLWWRLLRRMSSNRKVASQDSSLYGWSWTPHTSSWVEPTSLALLSMHHAPSSLLPTGALRRRKIAEAMIFDRMCPGGGWNCGNPMVYGVAGEPQISSTVWALLAMREHAERIENQQSLGWLEANWSRSQTPVSLALAHVALSAYGRPDTSIAKSLRAAYGKDGASWGVLELAWTVLALSDGHAWLTAATNGKSS